MSVHELLPRLINRAKPISDLSRRAEIMALAKAYNMDEGARVRFLRRVAIAGPNLSVQLSERAEIVRALKRHIACDTYVRRNRPAWAAPVFHRDELVAALVAELRQARKARRA